MKAEYGILQALGTAAVLGFALTACDKDAPDERAAAPVQAAERRAAEEQVFREKISVRGLLKHFPQDVKSTEAWLGHEFVVGETPIRVSDTVSREVLMKMVGETVEIEGLWNPGKKWEPPEPAEEEFNLQRPSYPKGVKIIRGSGLEASSVKRVET